MKRNFEIYLNDILDNIEKGESFVSGMSYSQFQQDSKSSYALLRCIEIIGEAVKHLPPSLRKKYPEIPWKDIAGMRDKVIHFYFGLDLKTVWLVVKEDFPRLKEQVEKILLDWSNSKLRNKKTKSSART